jgi:hypothetical protein
MSWNIWFFLLFNMCAWKDLPIEILNHIFSIIEDEKYEAVIKRKYTLGQCQLTCKNWSEYAKCYFYRKIEVPEPEDLKKLIFALNMPNSNAGKYVKAVKLKFSSIRVLPSEGWCQLLLLCCPNIEKLHINPLVHGCIFEEIRQAYEKGVCRHIKETPMFSAQSQDIELYYRAIYCLRNSLDHVSLDETMEVKPDITTEFLLERLKEFPNLRSLIVRMKGFETTYRIGEYTKTSTHFSRLMITWRNRTTPAENVTLDVDSITPCPTVKDLLIVRAPLTNNLLEYIMHAFPNINRLSLFRSGSNGFATEISNDVWVRFLLYLNARSAGEISAHRLFISDIPSVLASYFNTIESNKTLCIIYENKESNDHPHVNFSSELPSGEHSIFDFVSVVFHKIEHQDHLPLIPLLRKVGNSLESLSINTDFAHDHTAFFSDLSLDAICHYCSSLDSLSIRNLIIRDDSLEPQTNMSITKLQIIDCSLSLGAFPEISTRLPLLSMLTIKDLGFFNSSGIIHNDNHKYIVEMPSTSFDTLSWETSRWFDNINIKIVTSASVYYRSTGTSYPSDISFQKSWEDNTMFSLYILCRNIKVLKVKTGPNCLWRFCFTE